VPNADSVLQGLDPEQRAAASAVSGPVCILAGAGTGKTRAITHRIAYAVHSDTVAPDAILAVTFTARAASELRTRLRALGAGGVQARTFHAAALRQLSYFAPQILGGPMPEVASNSFRLVSVAANRMRLKTDKTELRDLTGEIDWAKSSLVSPRDYPVAAAKANRGISLTPGTVASVYETYEKVKRDSNQIDFTDLLLIMASALEESSEVARTVRAQYRYFVVDEYQDVSPVQHRLLQAWLGDRRDVCVVGDANQTIYSFAGAKASYLLDFADTYDDAVVVRLERDYRSTPQIVDLANRLIHSGSRSRASDSGLTLIGQRPDGPRPTFAEYDDEAAEAAAVASAARRLIKAGTPASEIAVLFRINAQSEAYEQALTELGLPYVLKGGEKFFDRAEVKQAMVLLRGAARTQDGEGALTEVVAEVLSQVGWESSAPPAGGAARDRWESLAALSNLAQVFAADRDAPGPESAGPESARPESPGAQSPEPAKPADLDAFNEDLSQRAAAQHAPTVQGVTLASLHSAKGLEWDAVFLVGLTDMVLPIQHATTVEQLDEERRLLYVGITRARVTLTLSWALARNPGQARRRKPSRFLDDLREPNAVRASGAPKRAKVVPKSADAAAFGRLRAWRKRQAEAQGVPAYVVFSDATLVAIADRAPGDTGALAAVPGVGPTKLERYADPVLAVLAGDDPEPVEIG
jgi:DNA helicase-2/ATP-dependent DNA helicase PcrA